MSTSRFSGVLTFSNRATPSATRRACSGGGQRGLAARVHPDTGAAESGGSGQPRAEFLHRFPAGSLVGRTERDVEVHQNEQIAHARIGGAAVQLRKIFWIGMVLTEQKAAVVQTLDPQFSSHAGKFQRVALRETRLAAKGAMKSPLDHRQPVAGGGVGGAGEAAGKIAGGKRGGGGGLEEAATVHEVEGRGFLKYFHRVGRRLRIWSLSGPGLKGWT